MLISFGVKGIEIIKGGIDGGGFSIPWSTAINSRFEERDIKHILVIYRVCLVFE